MNAPSLPHPSMNWPIALATSLFVNVKSSPYAVSLRYKSPVHVWRWCPRHLLSWGVDSDSHVAVTTTWLVGVLVEILLLAEDWRLYPGERSRLLASHCGAGVALVPNFPHIFSPSPDGVMFPAGQPRPDPKSE